MKLFEFNNFPVIRKKHRTCLPESGQLADKIKPLKCHLEPYLNPRLSTQDGPESQVHSGQLREIGRS